VEWLLSNVVPERGRPPVRVASCYEPFFTAEPLASDPRGAGFVNAPAPDRTTDIVLAGTRFGCADGFRAQGWRVLHTVERMGVPLLYVLAAPPRRG
jgi:hypothetical protein